MQTPTNRPSASLALTRLFDSRLRRRRSAAFTLVEVMVVVTIVGSLGSISLPRIKKATDTARASAVANDLRVLASAMSSVAQQTGRYPDNTNRGAIPPTAVGFTKATSWTAKTPIGGYYNWEPAQSALGLTFKAAIGINSSGGVNVSRDRALLLAIDRRIDDGNLSTGNFRLWDANEPLYVIEF